MTVRAYFNWTLALFVAAFLVLPNSKMVNNFYYLFMAIPGLVYLLSNYKQLKPISFAELSFLALCACTAGYAFFIYPKIITHALYVVVFAYVVARFVDADFFDSKMFARFLFWGGLLYVAVCAVSFYVIDDVSFGTRINPGVSRLYSPIHISMFVSCSLFVIGPHWLKDGSYWEGLLGVILAFLAIALLLQSRTGLVGMGIWSIFILFYMIRKFGTRGGVFLIIGLLVLVAVSVPIFDLAGQSARLIERADAHRLAIWKGYLLATYDCGLLLGCGFPVTPSSHLVLDHSGKDVFFTHNILVNQLYHYGLLLLVLFIIVMISVLRLAWQQRNWWGAYLLTGILLSMLDSNRIIDSPNEVWLMIWLPTALIFAREWQRRREMAREHN